MAFPISIQTSNSQYIASLLGMPNMQAVATSRREAVRVLKEKITTGIAQGELLFLDIDPITLADLAGKYADDPTLDEITEEIYRLRDAEVI